MGAKKNRLDRIERELYSGVNWYSVTDDNGQIAAIFDDRKAPNYFKNMQIFFNPDRNMNLDGEEYDDVVPIIDGIIGILNDILIRHLNKLENAVDGSYCKIYSDIHGVYLVFHEFCKYLKKHYPDLFTIKMYGRWIEIHRNKP